MIPELLAPAGNLECALAAADAGADAVYCGLPRFNARVRAANLSLDELDRLVGNFHSRNKKVYLTFNTLLYERELADAAALLADVAAIAPDALIVQDPAVISLVRNYFPTLKLHASTQMGIHNSAGVAAAVRMGCSRVILERQVSMEELKLICAKSPIEIEVFLHGSLCCSLSGRCLLSHALDGGSGNRGSCKQPCRRLYRCGGKEGFFLSMRDLNGIDRLPEYRRAGVASLKIEGRLRGPDYIWNVVRAYRTLLAGPVDPPPEAIEEALRLLHSAGSRKECSGFCAGGKSLVDSDHAGVFGREAGVIDQVLRRGLLVRATDKMHIGDKLRLVPPDGGEGESFSLLKLEKFERPVNALHTGERGFIPGSFQAGPGWKLCKFGESGFDFSRAAAFLPARKKELALNLSITSSELSVEISGIRWVKQVQFAPAERHALDRKAAAAAFETGAPEPWSVHLAKCEIGENLFAPAAVLKQLRRDFWAFAAPKLAGFAEENQFRSGVEAFQQAYALRKPAQEAVKADDEFHIPCVIPEPELEIWRKKIAEAYQKGIRSFRADGFHGLELLRQYDDCRKTVGFFPGVTNSEAGKLFQTMGASAAVIEPELNEEYVTELKKKSPLPLRREELEVPLLATRVHLDPPGIWEDRRGRKLRVEFDRFEKLWKIYSAK